MEEDTCYEFSAAVCPIEGPPLGSGGYDPGGREGEWAHFSMLGDTVAQTRKRRQIVEIRQKIFTVQKNRNKMLRS